MKKRLNMEWVKRIGNKAQNFIERRGFYISMILCVGIISISTLFITSNEIGNLVEVNPKQFNEMEFSNLQEPSIAGNAKPSAKPREEASAIHSPLLNKTDSSMSVGAMQREEILAKDMQEAKRKHSQVKYANASIDKVEVKTEEERVVFATPVQGEIINKFAKDNLLYSKTLNEWRSHLGIDIRADKGTPVKAIAKGLIREVKNDPRYGATVIIEHEGGWKSVYSNLLKADAFLEGRRVKQGDVIGGIGNSASFESLEPPHLHLELYKNGELMDPATYLPQ